MLKVSAFEALKTIDTTPEKSTTATKVVIRLLFEFYWSRIINIGTISDKPPVRAIMNRANLSTNGDTTSGNNLLK